MPKKQKDGYLVYGDDIKAQIDNLDSLTADLDAMVDKETKKALKKRYKDVRKRGGSKTEAAVPSERLEDIRSDMGNSAYEDLPDEEEEKPKEKKPKKKPNIILIVLIIIVVGSLLTVAWFVFSPMIFPSDDAEPTPTPSADIFKGVTETKMPELENAGDPIDVNNTPDPEATETPSAVVVTKGLLPEISITSEVQLSDTLVYATTINSTIQAYYDSILSNIKEYVIGYNIESKMDKYTAMLDFDIKMMESQYKSIYGQFGGDDYYNNSLERFRNIKTLTESLENSMSVNDINTTANNYIRNENTLAEKSRSALIEYLDANGVVYSDEDESKITYDELPEETATPESTAEAESTASPSAGAEAGQ